MMIVTKYVKGGSLHSYVHSDAPLGFSLQLKYAIEMARGMVYK